MVYSQPQPQPLSLPWPRDCCLGSIVSGQLRKVNLEKDSSPLAKTKTKTKAKAKAETKGGLSPAVGIHFIFCPSRETITLSI